MELLQLIFFYVVALVTLVAGIGVISCRNPINSAISLVMTFFCLAVFYVMLHAPFMAAIQVMVYAGAIMVLIIFVMMLLNQGLVAIGKHRHALVGAGIAAALLVVQMVITVTKGQVSEPVGAITAKVVESVGHTQLIGQAMFTDFLLPFEIASILLLVAIIGAVVLAKREV